MDHHFLRRRQIVVVHKTCGRHDPVPQENSERRLDEESAGRVLLCGDDGHIRPLAELETEIIAAAVHHYDGRISEVARRLDIGRSTLYRKFGQRDQKDG